MWTFTARAFDSPCPERNISVNYDGFAEDVRVGDEVVVDGGMLRFVVTEKIGPMSRADVLIPDCCYHAQILLYGGMGVWSKSVMPCFPPYLLRTSLVIMLSEDWLDIDFGIAEAVDFIAVSFVKSAEVINHLKSYIAARSKNNRNMDIIAKIESIDSLQNLEEIVQASDCAMVARGDLGAQIPLEQVPSIQKIVQLCRQLNKPVIVASQLLESMIEYPIPTRAAVADVSEAVAQKADALMLSGESAMGRYPEKALAVLRSVSLRIERRQREEKHYDTNKLSDILSSIFLSEQICIAAAKMANNLEADLVFVYTKTGYTASPVM